MNHKPITNYTTPMELDYVEGSKGRFYGKGKNLNTFPPRKKDECHRCGKPGHYTKECRSFQPKAKFANIEESSSSSSSSYISINNNAELTFLEDNRERLLRFKGKVNGHSAWILLDSGASRNFIDEKFVQQHKLSTQGTKSFSVELADGRKKEITQAVNIKKLSLEPYHTSGISAQVLNLQRYDVILGKPWLFHANPTIDWRKNTMTFNYGKRTIHVKANSETPHTSYNSILISRHQLANISTTEELFAVCTTTLSKENSESMSPKAKELIKEYQDVFSISLPNELPPK